MENDGCFCFIAKDVVSDVRQKHPTFSTVHSPLSTMF